MASSEEKRASKWLYSCETELLEDIGGTVRFYEGNGSKTGSENQES